MLDDGAIVSAVKAALGHDAIRFPYKLNGRDMVGWHSAELWPDPQFQLNPVVEKWWRQFSALDIRLFVLRTWSGELSGSEDTRRAEEERNVRQFSVYALPGLEVLSVLRFAQVGHPWIAPDRLSRALRSVDAVCPFEFLVAGPTVMHCAFLRPIGSSEAAALAPLLIEVSAEGAMWMRQELVDEGHRAPARGPVPASEVASELVDAVRQYILERGRFKLEFH